VCLSTAAHATVSCLLLFTLVCLSTAAHATMSCLLLFTLQCPPLFTLQSPLLLTLQCVVYCCSRYTVHCRSRIPNHTRLQHWPTTVWRDTFLFPHLTKQARKWSDCCFRTWRRVAWQQGTNDSSYTSGGSVTNADDPATEAAEAPVISVYRCQSARYLHISLPYRAQTQRFYYLRMQTLSPKRRY